MNAEIMRIRKARGMSDEITAKPKRISEEELVRYSYALNINMTELYNLKFKENVKIDKYVENFTQNMLIILEILSEMNIYPDYFFDVVFRRKIDINNLYNGELTKNSRAINGNSETIGKKILDGLEKGYYKIKSYGRRINSDRSVNDYFLEILSYYQVFNIPYGNKSSSQCKKSFNDHYFHITNIMSEYLNSDYLYADVEYLINLLFEYFSFFVEIGVNPKEYLDSLMDEKLNNNTRKK